MYTIKCPVPIYQNEWEFSHLLKIYQDRNPARVMEIGTFFGGTMWFWLQNPRLEKLYCLDLPIPDRDPRFEHRAVCQKRWHTWPNFDKLVYVQGNSQDANIITRMHAVQKVDWLFIDGDHTYRGVKRDYENYRDMVNPGGLIIFHDVIYSRGVKKLWKNIQKNNQCTEITSHIGGMGIGIIETL